MAGGGRLLAANHTEANTCRQIGGQPSRRTDSIAAKSAALVYPFCSIPFMGCPSLSGHSRHYIILVLGEREKKTSLDFYRYSAPYHMGFSTIRLFYCPIYLAYACPTLSREPRFYRGNSYAWLVLWSRYLVC